MRIVAEMGLFLALSGVIGARASEVESAIKAYADTRNGKFIPESLSSENDQCLVITSDPGGVSLLYPSSFMDWSDASSFLSTQTRKPVFAFHIHDSDLWMYELFDSGELVDRFNPLPDYWGALDDDKRKTWRGNAAEIARRVPGLEAAKIERYLVAWTDELTSPAPQRAYADDEFTYGVDWQLVDFIKRLGLSYPIDDHGEPFGDTFCFSVPE